MDLFDFYARLLLPLTPAPAVTKLLQLLMDGGETTDEIAKVVATDPELLHWLRLTVQRLGMEERAQRTQQIIVLLGQNRIRNLVIGRHIERAFVPEGKTL